MQGMPTEPEMMDFFEVIKNRRSIRAFKKLDIEEIKLKIIFEAINSAPSAGDLQAYEVFVVRSEGKKRELAKAALGQDFIASAPVVLVFCANPKRSAWKYGKRGEKLYCIQDATIACSFAHLSATALGLGSVWVGAFSDSEVLKIIGAEDKGLIPVSILPIGYPAEDPAPTPRRPLYDLIHHVE